MPDTADPEVAESCSQLPPTAVATTALHCSVPPPEFEMLSVCGEGVAPASVAKRSCAGSTLTCAGVDGVTVSVTLAVCVAGLAPGTVIVTVPRYAPALSFVASTPTRMRPGRVPVAGFAESQLPALVV